MSSSDQAKDSAGVSDTEAGAKATGSARESTDAPRLSVTSDDDLLESLKDSLATPSFASSDGGTEKMSGTETSNGSAQPVVKSSSAAASSAASAAASVAASAKPSATASPTKAARPAGTPRPGTTTSAGRPATATRPAPGSSKPGGTASVKVAGAKQLSGGSGRSVHLTVSSVDPFTVLKLSFLLSVALGIASVVAAIVIWSVLSGMGVFSQINSVFNEMGGAGDASKPFDIYDYVGLGRVISVTIVLGVINVLLITAMSTVGAYLYNFGSGLVGGLNLTLTDD